MYHTLFNAITDALELLKSGNAEAVEALLMAAQQKTEELYIEAT